jgi:hypothetical protein
MKKILLISMLLYTTLFAMTFDEYKKQQTTQYQNYKNNLDKELKIKLEHWFLKITS